jgi:hypothetical protein
MRLFVVIALLFSVNGAVSAAENARITTSVEIRHVQPLLRKVAHGLEGGFQRAEADRLAAEIRTMPANQSMSWSFTVRYRGVDHPLQVRALLDELGTVDLDFATSAALAPVLRSGVDTYLNAHNL